MNCYRITLINENLKHVMHATYSAEPAMLGWETIFALIEGQLIIAYFDCKNNSPQYIALFGLILSFSWLLLVSINHMHQDYRSKVIKYLEADLKKCYHDEMGLNFWSEDICKDQRAKWWLLGVLPIEWIPEDWPRNLKPLPLRKWVTSTWTYRFLIPLILTLGWISSFVWSIRDCQTCV